MRLVLAALSACLFLAWLLWPERATGPVTGGEQARAPEQIAPPLLAAKGVAKPAPRPKPLPRPRPARLPADPVVRGTSRLALHLTDRSGEPAHTRVSLWRIGAPANDDYEAGDLWVAQRYSVGGTCTFDKLAEGVYRIYTLAARVGGEDPVAFEVRGARTELHLELDTPERFPVYLQLYDERGGMLREGRTRLVDAERGGSNYAAPSWRLPRKLRQELRADTLYFGIGGVGGHIPGGGAPRTRTAWTKPRPLTASARGFEISRELEPPREGGWITEWECGYGEHGRVQLRAQPPPSRALTYVAPALSRTWLRETVFLPDGHTAHAAGAEFRVHSKAVLVPEEGTVPDVRTMPLDIVVRLKGYRRLLVTYRQQDPLPRWVLEKR